MTAVAYQMSLMLAAGIAPTSLTEANALLVEWGHYLGPCQRPFGAEAWVLEVASRPVSVAVGASIVSTTVAGCPRNQVVELARLCSAPDARWATRPMLRLWREVAAPTFGAGYDQPWTVRAAVAYSANTRHEGTIYRFDGWERANNRCGDGAGPASTWTKPRGTDHPARGPKTLWIWRYPTEDPVALGGAA